MIGLADINYYIILFISIEQDKLSDVFTLQFLSFCALNPVLKYTANQIVPANRNTSAEVTNISKCCISIPTHIRQSGLNKV